jgi:HEAT repeat protein
MRPSSAPLRLARLCVLFVAATFACAPAGAVCPSHQGRPAPPRPPPPSDAAPNPAPRAAPTDTVPPNMRQPFAPPRPPEDAPDETPPEEPSDAAEPPPPPEDTAPPPPPPPAKDPAADAPPPPPPPAAPLPTTTPNGPDLTGPGRGRGRVRGEGTLDDISWQTWWGLHRAGVLPVVRRQAGAAPDGPYARLLPSELRAAVDVLLTALEDRDPDVRYAAAGALAGVRCDYRAGETIEALRACTRGQDRWLRDLCHLGLGLRQDVEAIPRLLAVLRSRQEMDVSRAFAALALIDLGPDAALEDLAAVTRDLDEPDLAGCVLIGLGAKKEPRHLPLLLEAARRRTGPGVRLRRVRADALTALGSMAHPSTAPYLGELLQDPENAIARSAAIALGGFRSSDVAAMQLCTRGLTSQDPWVRALACISLGRLGLASAAPALGHHARNDAEPAVRPFALLGLGLLGQPSAIHAVGAHLLEEPRTGVYGAAALSAGLLGARDLRPPLIAGVGDKRTHLAPACGAIGLGLLGATEAESRLRARFWLDSAQVRPGFDEALALLAPESTAQWLTGELERARHGSARAVVVDGLARCGGVAEGARLAALYQTTHPGDLGLRVRILWALAAVLRDREVTQAQRLLFHGYYLQPNPVLGHLALLP